MSLNCGKGACQVFPQRGEGSRSLPFTESHCKGLHSSNTTSIMTWPSRPGVAGNRLQNKKGFINHANQNKSPHCYMLGCLQHVTSQQPPCHHHHCMPISLPRPCYVLHTQNPSGEEAGVPLLKLSPTSHPSRLYIIYSRLYTLDLARF